MLKYTRGVIGDTIDAIKRLARGIEITVQIVYIAYLIVAIALGTGILYANIALLVVSVLYFIYDLASTREFYTKVQKKHRENVKTTVKITKRLTHIVIITVAIIELSTAPKLDAISLIMTFLMIIGFVISLIFDIAISMVDDRKELIVNAVALDLKPKKVIDVVHKITGHKQTEEEIEEEKIRAKLEEICQEQQDKKLRKKAWLKNIKEKLKSKRKKEAEKQEKKDAKKEEKENKKAEKETVKWK